MGRRLIVDTNVLVAIERGRRETLDVVEDDDEVAIAAVTLAELRTGIELAPEDAVADSRRASIDSIVGSIEVLDYTEVTASHHAALLAHTRRTGRPRGAHDLIIAATAAQTGRLLLTHDSRARFGDLPGVHLA